MAGDNFISRSGTGNFDTYEIANTDFTDLGRRMFKRVILKYKIMNKLQKIRKK